MASANPLSTLPDSGVFPVDFSSAFLEASGAKKRRRDMDEVIAMRSSISSAPTGRLEVEGGKAKLLQFDIPSGSRQVFDVREESSKTRECVLIWDEEEGSFTLHPLPNTLHLTINRSLSNPRARPAAAATSLALPTETNSRPTSRRNNHDEVDSRSSGSNDHRHEVSSVLGIEEDLPRGKRRRSVAGASSSPEVPKATLPAAPARPKTGGKSLPRKTPLMASAPIPDFSSSGNSKKAKAAKSTAPRKTPTKSAASKGKKAAAAPVVVKGKIKSAEIIEDSDVESDEDMGVDDGGEDEDGVDLFAKMIGESLVEDGTDELQGTGNAHAYAQEQYNDYEDEDEDDEDEGEEDDEENAELGGARLIVDDDGSEWL